MSRVAKAPINVPAGVEISVSGQDVKVKGKVGELAISVNAAVEVVVNDNVVSTLPREGFPDAWAQAGTARANINNMVVGVADGFEKKLILNGVGYRAAVKGNVLNLSLGFSHPVNFEVPTGVTVEAPSQTEIVVKGASKHLVGQVAANIRKYREPEPYKGKGIRYSDENVRRKEAKKK
ncbi:50S ribosomal protein L6 [Psychrosphaera sp. B3R10]|uniref:50S ribosomal protein L6 n=1 Tax=unclassified Psychrosphaera TaxID=2641570 RepID=UPI001C08B37C|nr:MULTISPECIES: 50S ribosomal protein L6 [unclassified Psychrosphaera]MBU2880678.1 50S ribosomal protein L6 [Psychrosphaera sp. I2R16]MBU2990764.1 50S ribosomal protein L6 [Psychrosphaera sp. B3R10]MDO6720884.1 50S ribosomal protein L6 [Psychrosphaera sp. 1_MG-2023]